MARRITNKFIRCWVICTKILLLWHRFSSHQLVFSQNPNFINIVNKIMPALHGTFNSAILDAHLNNLHSVRKAFVELESCEHIRQAYWTQHRLQNNVRTVINVINVRTVVRPRQSYDLRQKSCFLYAMV